MASVRFIAKGVGATVAYCTQCPVLAVTMIEMFEMALRK